MVRLVSCGTLPDVTESGSELQELMEIPSHIFESQEAELPTPFGIEVSNEKLVAWDNSSIRQLERGSDANKFDFELEMQRECGVSSNNQSFNAEFNSDVPNFCTRIRETAPVSFKTRSSGHNVKNQISTSPCKPNFIDKASRGLEIEVAAEVRNELMTKTEPSYPSRFTSHINRQVESRVQQEKVSIVNEEQQAEPKVTPTSINSEGIGASVLSSHYRDPGIPTGNGKGIENQVTSFQRESQNVEEKCRGSQTGGKRAIGNGSSRVLPLDTEPSKFCHICGRTGNISGIVCDNFRFGTCRKVLCEKCRLEYEVNPIPMICTHCTGACPKRAKCHGYTRANRERSSKKQKTSPSANSTPVHPK